MPPPFTTAEAKTRGIGRGALRGPAVRREFRGVYALADSPSGLADAIAAARRVVPGDVLLDGTTALRSYGVEVGEERPLRFVTAHPHQVRRPGLLVRRLAKLPAPHLQPEAGPDDHMEQAEPPPPRVTPAAAFVAAARELDLLDLVAAGDRLVRLGLLEPAELVVAAAASSGRGALHARRAAGLVRPGVDSVRETRLRLCLVLAGLPEPEVNPTVTVGYREVGRVDLRLKRWRVTVEYDGDQHRTDRRQWNIDIARNELLTGDGELVVRITAERMRHPRAVVALVVSALRERGWDGPAPVFDEEWHRLFPSAR